MFSCCQEPLECWATFSSLFHRRYSKETALLAAPETVDNQEDGQMNGPFDPPISISKELKSSLKHNTTITATLTSEERDKLSQILALLQKKYETVTLASSEEMKDTLDSNFEKGTNASHESSYSFLYELGLAASEVTLQTEQAASPISSGDNYLSYGENPEAAIQQLLQAGKQTELLRERQRKHIRLLQCLEKEFPKLLSPLRHCWSDLERSLKDTANDIIQQQQIFGQISSVLLGCRGVPDTLKLLWKVLDKEMEEYEIQSSEDKIYNLIRLCFRFAVVQTFLTTKVEDDKRQEQLKSSINALLQNNSEPGNTRDCAIQTMVDSFWNFSKKNQYSEIEQKDDTALQLLFQQWLEIHAPSLLSSLSMCMKAVFFPSLSEESSNAEEDTGWLLPRLDKETTDSLLFSSTSGPVSPWLYAVACTMPLHHHKNVGTTWTRLYSSNSEGLNLSTLEHSLTGYHGPTVILLEAYDPNTKADITVGAYASQTWKIQKSPDFYGDEQCYLFQLRPVFKVFRTKSEEEHPHVARHFQYFHFKPATKAPSSQSKFAQGIGLGGSSKHPRFFVSSTLEKAHFSPTDATFESNEDAKLATAVMSNPYLDLHSIEVWGVGGDTALEARKQHRRIQEAHLGKARQVNKAAFLNDFRSGLIESKMFNFYEDIRNRDGGCMLDGQDFDHDDEQDDVVKNWQIGAPPC